MIKQNVIDQLVWDSKMDANNIFVNVNSGKVELSGQVQSLAARVAAERYAFEVNGVMDVDNRLEVTFPPGRSGPTDQEIRDKAQSLITWNQDLGSDYIRVNCKKGIISLEGKVETYREKHLASQQVVTLDGVLDVDNRLEVSPTSDILDHHIHKEISEAFRRVHIIDEKRLLVEVKNGKVTLSGEARDFFSKMHARNVAIQTNGVIHVEDNIQIKYN